MSIAPGYFDYPRRGKGLDHDRFEHLILVENYHRAKVSPDEVLTSVKQVAFYGDWLEKRLSKEDAY